MVRFCSECGEKLEGTPKYCPECGSKIIEKKESRTVTLGNEKIKNLKKEKPSKLSSLFDNIYKKSIVIGFASLLLSFYPSNLITAYPIKHTFEYRSDYLTIIPNLFYDWIFWTLIIFAILFIFISWKNLGKKELSVSMMAVIIAIILAVLLTGFNIPEGSGKVTITETNGYHSSIGYVVNGTIENTWGTRFDKGIIFITIYDKYGMSLDSYYENLDIPPHSSYKFIWEFLPYDDYHPSEISNYQVEFIH